MLLSNGSLGLVGLGLFGALQGAPSSGTGGCRMPFWGYIGTEKPRGLEHPDCAGVESSSSAILLCVRETLLNELVTHYRSRLSDSLQAVVLYGSRARGSANLQSDVDVLIIAASLPGDPFERSRLLHPPRCAQNDPAVSIRGLTTNEYERDIAPLDLDIALDGRIIFDRCGYMQERLALIRQRLNEAGLFRDSELVWRWRRWPTRPDWAITWEGIRV